MTALLDKMYAEAEGLFGIDGLGNVLYANKQTWMGLVSLWRGKAKAHLDSFVAPNAWEALTLEDAKKADTAVYVLASDAAGVALDWVKKNLLGQDVATMSGGTLTTFLMASYTRAAQSLALHESDEMQASIDAGSITEEDARKNLDESLRTMETLAKAGDKGLYTPLGGLSGLGVDPLTVAVVVTVVALIAWYYIYETNQTARVVTTKVAQEAMNRCDKLLATDPELYVQCVHGVQLNVPKTGDLMEPLTGATKILAYGVAAGVLVWVGVKFVLPALVETGHIRGRSEALTGP